MNCTTTTILELNPKERHSLLNIIDEYLRKQYYYEHTKGRFTEDYADLIKIHQQLAQYTQHFHKPKSLSSYINDRALDNRTKKPLPNPEPDDFEKKLREKFLDVYYSIPKHNSKSQSMFPFLEHLRTLLGNQRFKHAYDYNDIWATLPTLLQFFSLKEVSATIILSEEELEYIELLKKEYFKTTREL